MKPLRLQMERSLIEVKIEGLWSGRVVDMATALEISENGDERICQLEAMLREFADPLPLIEEAEAGLCGPAKGPSRVQRARAMLGFPAAKEPA